jgi:hypothetical protein
MKLERADFQFAEKMPRGRMKIPPLGSDLVAIPTLKTSAVVEHGM